MAIKPIIVAESISADQAREKLQLALNMLLVIAAKIESLPVREVYEQPTLRELWQGHIMDMPRKLSDLASDDIPF